MALLTDGTVRTWGQGTNGELGNGTTTARQTSPVTPAISGVRQLAGGRNHVLALMTDGTVKAWGQNTTGQLGDGTTTNRSTPVTVPGLTNIVAVEGGAEFSVALSATGTVYTWGRNNNGQLGRNGSADAHSPGAITGLPAMKAIGCGRDHALASTTSTGQLYGWGLDINGALGDRAGAARRTPVAVSGVTKVSQIHGGYGYTVILRNP
jgi:alpha-tubulin suppressor-like RCC1 family protein